MQTSPTMEAVIWALAKKHGFDLTRPGSYLRLEMPHFDRLVVEVLSEHLVQVAHVYEPRPGLYQADPGLVFFTGYTVWVPIEVNQRVGGYRVYATLSAEQDEIETFLPAPQADLAAFAETWAQALKQQGWLDEGVRVEEPSPPKIGRPLFRLGQVVATPGAMEALERAGQLPDDFLQRHVRGEWGELDEYDRQANEQALQEGSRIVSVYTTNLGTRLYVITEWDRSATTLLLPEEY